MFAAASPGIMLLYALWLLNDYGATALDGIVTPPPVLDSIGIWGYRQPFPALLPLLLHLLTTLAIAGLSRNQLAGHAASIMAAPLAPRPAEQEESSATPGLAEQPAGPGAVRSAGVAGAGEEQGMRMSAQSPGIAIPGAELLGSSPLSAAGRELRSLVTFGGRMSYTEGQQVVAAAYGAPARTSSSRTVLGASAAAPLWDAVCCPCLEWLAQQGCAAKQDC